jgi:hypothetical protein
MNIEGFVGVGVVAGVVVATLGIMGAVALVRRIVQVGHDLIMAAARAERRL